MNNVFSYDVFRQKLETAQSEMIAVTTELPLSAEDIERLQLLFVARVMQLRGEFHFRMATSLQREGDVAAARVAEQKALEMCEAIVLAAARKVAIGISQALQQDAVKSDAVPATNPS